MLHPWVHAPNGSNKNELGKPRSQALDSDLPHGWWRPKNLTSFTAFLVHSQGAGLKVKHPRLELAFQYQMQVFPKAS